MAFRAEADDDQGEPPGPRKWSTKCVLWCRCQATAKTGPEVTRKLVHPVEKVIEERKCGAGAAFLEPMASGGGSAVQSPEDVEAMRRLGEAGWGRRWMAKELGCAPVVRQKLEREKNIKVSLCTVERAVDPWSGSCAIRSC